MKKSHLLGRISYSKIYYSIIRPTPFYLFFDKNDQILYSPTSHQFTVFAHRPEGYSLKFEESLSASLFVLSTTLPSKKAVEFYHKII
jgi:hypothetical protein